jgi:hypothetical protein
MKRALGIGYLVGSGATLAVVLFLRFPLGGEVSRVTAIGTASGILLSVTLSYTGYWLDQLHLEDDQIWRVAQFGAFGIGAFLIASIGVIAWASALAILYVLNGVLGLGIGAFGVPGV